MTEFNVKEVAVCRVVLFPNEVLPQIYSLGIYEIFHINNGLNLRCGSRIDFRVLQNFTKKIEPRNDVICRKIIDSARSKKAQL